MSLIPFIFFFLAIVFFTIAIVTDKRINNKTMDELEKHEEDDN